MSNKLPLSSALEHSEFLAWITFVRYFFTTIIGIGFAILFTRLFDKFK